MTNDTLTDKDLITDDELNCLRETYRTKCGLRLTLKLIYSNIYTDIRFSNYIFKQNFYAALCNNVWIDSDNQEYRFSWRGAAHFVSKINFHNFHEKENYLSYYCSGMKCEYRQDETILVEEGIVTEEISEVMETLGLILIEGIDIYEDEYFSDISLC